MRTYPLRVAEPPPQIKRQIVSDDSVELAWAGICLDCDRIYDLRRDSCPCGSKVVLPLARVLGTGVPS